MVDLFSRIEADAKGCAAERDFSFAAHTTIGIGGKAPLCLHPEGAAAAVHALRLCRRFGVPHLVLGMGANVLAADGGFDGVVLCTDRMRALSLQGRCAAAESGVCMPRLLRCLAENGLGGFAFMAGIPASVGGAVYMNAGTARGHFGDRVLSVTAVDADGEIVELSGKECAFAYKNTAFTGKNMLILSARLQADYCCYARANDEIGEVLRERARLPKGKSMGCVFKNSEGMSAGEIIDRAGLKGAAEGDAFVSAEHANFIINGGHATAKDVRALIGRVKGTVLERTGIALTEEIEYIGDD